MAYVNPRAPRPDTAYYAGNEYPASLFGTKLYADGLTRVRVGDPIVVKLSGGRDVRLEVLEVNRSRNSVPRFTVREVFSMQEWREKFAPKAKEDVVDIGQQVKREYEAIIDLGFTDAQARTIIVSRSIALGNESKKKPQAEPVPHLHVSLSGDLWEG